MIFKYGLKLGKRLRKDKLYDEATDVLSATLLNQVLPLCGLVGVCTYDLVWAWSYSFSFAAIVDSIVVAVWVVRWTVLEKTTRTVHLCLLR